MFKFLNLNPELFSIDINDLFLRIIKLNKKRGGFKIVSFNEVQIKEGIVKEGVIQDKDALVKIIKLACSTVKGKKLDTKYIIASLPEEKSFSQVIQMPKMTYEELESAVPFEAENYIPLSIDKVYLDFQIIDNSGSKHNNQNHLDLLINVMPKHIVDAYVSCFKNAGLIPSILEVESQAIVKALLKNNKESTSCIFIDFGQTKTSLIIFSGNSIRFTSSIPISSQQLTDAISSGLGISSKDAEDLKTKHGLVAKKDEKTENIADLMNPILCDLVDQIKKYLNFYHGHVSHEFSPSEGKIEKVILCGGGANLKMLPDFLFKKLNIHIELGNPFLNILPQKKSDDKIITNDKISSFTTALGLGLRGSEYGSFNEHNS